MRDRDYNDSIQFLSEFFQGTEGDVELRAIANTGGMVGRVFTRSPDDVQAFLARRDVSGVAVYFGPCTRITGSHQGRKEDLVESVGVWVDIDCYKLGISVADAVAALKGCPFPPTVIICSGGGVHAYWLWREPIPLPDPDGRLEAVLQQLAGVFCGDPLPAQVAAVMRLPGSHNSKSGEMVPCVVLEASWTRWELDDLEEALFRCRQLIAPPAGPAGPSAAKAAMGPETDPFVAFARQYAFKPPIDVEAAIRDMTYGGGENGIHRTQLRVSASLVNTAGWSDEAIVDLLIMHTRRVAPPNADRWNWVREEKNLAGMIRTMRDRRRAEGKDPYPQPAAPPSEIPGPPEPPKVVQLRPREQTTPPVPAAAAFGDHPFNDYGNAMRMLARHGAKLRYCVNVGWHVWDGKRFKFDPEDIKTLRLAQETAKAMLLSAFGSVIEGKDKLIKFAIQCGNAARIGNMVSQLKVQDLIGVEADDLNADAMLLNCLNGTVDLRTGVLRPHDQADLLTKICGVAYDPDAACPRWERFVEEVFDGDQELVGFLRRALGYSLSGDTRENAIFILHGSGANGKTVLIEAMAAVMGEYTKHSPSDTWTASATPQPSNDLAALVGARFVPVVETERGKQLAEARIKQATGGDRIPARFLYHETFDYLPQFKLWFATNHRPKIRGSDHAIWRRVYLIPFTVRFVEAIKAIGGQKIKDPELAKKLKAEREGILAWMVRGCLEWLKNGLNPPEAVRVATEAYQDSEDNISGFVRECCNQSRGLSCGIGLLYAGYEIWCEEADQEPATKRAFISSLDERGFRPGPRTNRERLRQGIDLQEVFKSDAAKRQAEPIKKPNTEGSSKA